jgi:hypothetical protein
MVGTPVWGCWKIYGSTTARAVKSLIVSSFRSPYWTALRFPAFRCITCTLFIRGMGFSNVGYVDLALVRSFYNRGLLLVLLSLARLYDRVTFAPRWCSPARRGCYRCLAALARLFRSLNACILPVAWVKLTLPVEDTVSFLVTGWALQICRSRAVVPRMFS